MPDDDAPPTSPPPVPQGLDPAVTLVNVLLRYGGEVIRDDRAGFLVRVPTATGIETLVLRSEEFRAYLDGLYLDYFRHPDRHGDVQCAIRLLRAQAIHARPVLLHNRFARVGREIYIDLADGSGRAIHVNESGWTIVRNAPVEFRRHQHQRPLPVPAPGGDVELLLDTLHLPGGDEWLLVLAWALWAMVEGVPHPVLLFVGGTDSGKTTTARLLRSAIDPSAMATVIAPKGLIEIALALDAHAVPVFDNVTRLNQSDTDLMCQVVSGAGFQKRKLKTDTGSITLDIQRAPMMTSIPRIPSGASDFLNRCVRVVVQKLTDEERRDETEMREAFEADAPFIFGALLDLQVEAIRAERGIVVPGLPRMSGYARRGEALSRVLGNPPGRFIEALNRNLARVADDVVFADPVAAAVHDLALAESFWEGTALQLLNDLQRYWRPHDARERPRSEDALGKRLVIAEPVLARIGVEVAWGRRGDRANARLIRIRLIDQERTSSPQPSVRSARSVRPPGNGGNDGGGQGGRKGLVSEPRLLPPHGPQGEA